MRLEGSQNPLKGILNETLGRRGELWGASRLQERQKDQPSSMELTILGTFWEIVGAMLGPAGFRRVPQIIVLGVEFNKMRRNRVQEGVQKIHMIIMDFDTKMGGLNCKSEVLVQCLLQFRRFRWVAEFSENG